METFISRFSKAWHWLLACYKILSPAVGCFLIAALVPVLFCGLDQGQDMLRGLASQSSFFPQQFLFLVALSVLGLACWGWSRVLLFCDFGLKERWGDNQSVMKEETANKCRRVMRWTCGLMPPAGIAAGFLMLLLNPSVKSDKGGWLAGDAIVIGAMLAAFFWVGITSHYPRRIEDIKTSVF